MRDSVPLAAIPQAEDWTTFEAVRLLEWFRTWEQPERPLDLDTYFLIADLREDISHGPAGPHIHAGRVIAQLQELHTRAAQNGWPLYPAPAAQAA
jgi:hypothetical protein